MLDEESRAQVHSGLDRLSTLDRETLVAFYFDGRSLNEMSDEFRTPVGTIKRRLHVARKRLARAAVGGDGVRRQGARSRERGVWNSPLPLLFLPSLIPAPALCSLLKK